MKWMLIAMVLLLAIPCLAADSPFMPVGSLVAAVDGGPAIGAAFSWDVGTALDMDWYVDLGLKRGENLTDYFGGVSTNACVLLDKLPIIKWFVPTLAKVLPKDTCLGWEYAVRAEESMLVLRTPLTDF